jgi:serine/threonine protein kinase
MARLISAGDFVGLGERRAAEHLEAELPKSWVVICNKELVNPDGTTREVDFVVIGNHAVFSVEEKSWSGAIHGDENGWVLTSGESYSSPLSQAGAAARRIAGLLRRNVPGLRDRLGDQHFVFARVLLTGSELRVFVHDPRVPTQILRLETCAEALTEFDRQQGAIASIAPSRDAILRELCGLQDRPKYPRKVRDYRVDEVLTSQGAVRCLRASHPDGSVRVLKLLPRPQTASTQRREDQERALLREYDALRRLAERQVAPRVDPYFSWQDDAFWVVPVHTIVGRSIRADRAQAEPSSERVLQVALQAFRALAAVHAVGVVHRSLTPDRVILRPDDSVAFIDFLIARIEGEQTVAGEVRDLDADNAYRAPECRVDLGLAEKTSDVYSLAASFMYWIMGVDPPAKEAPSGQGAEATPITWPRLNAARTDLGTDRAAVLQELLDGCLQEDERRRPVASDVADRLQRFLSPPPSHSPPSAVLQPGDRIMNQYAVLRVLGQGGTAITYLARDEVAEEDVVLKVIRDPERALQLARAEFRFLRDLHHPNLPRIYDIRPPSDPFHLKFEYIRGSSLRDLRDEYNGRADAVLQIGSQVLAALEYLHERRLLHRDIAPGNVLIPDEEGGRVKLIDFGLATAEADTASVLGTPAYRAPEVEAGERWSERSDLYSLGVMLFELLTNRLPYEVDDGRRSKRRLVPATAEEDARFGRAVLNVLLRACEADQTRRFQSAREFHEALERTPDQPTPAADGAELVNPFVDDLRRAYRNSRLGNRDNRGLDSDFARQTYVPTELDVRLLPEILSGRFHLVLLSGNPGDGKTAFLEQLGEELSRRGAAAERQDGSGWTMRLGDRRFAALYDASESHQGRSADDMLSELLGPLGGNLEPLQSYTALVAVNDGRLLDYFERLGPTHYPWLWDRLRPQFDQSPSANEPILLVDLKQRSLMGPNIESPSLFRGIIDQFTGTDRWRTCEGCVARLECPIRLNALSLGDAKLGATVRAQLHRLMLAVYWRRERRATIRDWRSALAFLITHDLSCREIHDERRHGLPVGRSDRWYFNAVFNATGGDDVLLNEWQEFDPRLVATPRLDRFIHFHRQAEQRELVTDLFESALARLSLPLPSAAASQATRLQELKRRYSFEARPGAMLHGQEAPLPETLIPYRHLASFRDAVLRRRPPEDLLPWLLRALARADGVPLSACGRGLAFRTAESDDAELVVVKLLAGDQFRLHVPASRAAFAESLADHLVLEHTSGDPILLIDLDLWELLGRATEGFLPGPEEQQALREEIAVFKNRLLAHPVHEVVLIEPGEQRHRVAVREGRICRVEGPDL